MTLSVLLLILTAVSTTAYFSGRIYLLLAANTAQAVEMDAKVRQFYEGTRKAPPPSVPNPGIY